jgi:hypothetical protein
VLSTVAGKKLLQNVIIFTKLLSIMEGMVKKFASGLFQGAILGFVGGVVAACLCYGLMAAGVLNSSGVMSGIYAFVTHAGFFNPWGLIAFSTVFGAAGQAVAEVSRSIFTTTTPQISLHRDPRRIEITQESARAHAAGNIAPSQSQNSHISREQARRSEAATHHRLP